MFTDFLHDFSFSSFFINKYRPRNIMNNDQAIFSVYKIRWSTPSQSTK